MYRYSWKSMKASRISPTLPSSATASPTEWYFSSSRLGTFLHISHYVLLPTAGYPVSFIKIQLRQLNCYSLHLYRIILYTPSCLLVHPATPVLGLQPIIERICCLQLPVGLPNSSSEKTIRHNLETSIISKRLFLCLFRQICG